MYLETDIEWVALTQHTGFGLLIGDIVLRALGVADILPTVHAYGADIADIGAIIALEAVRASTQTRPIIQPTRTRAGCALGSRVLALRAVRVAGIAHSQVVDQGPVLACRAYQHTGVTDCVVGDIGLEVADVALGTLGSQGARALLAAREASVAVVAHICRVHVVVQGAVAEMCVVVLEGAIGALPVAGIHE